MVRILFLVLGDGFHRYLLNFIAVPHSTDLHYAYSFIHIAYHIF